MRRESKQQQRAIRLTLERESAAIDEVTGHLVNIESDLLKLPRFYWKRGKRLDVGMCSYAAPRGMAGTYFLRLPFIARIETQAFVFVYIFISISRLSFNNKNLQSPFEL